MKTSLIALLMAVTVAGCSLESAPRLPPGVDIAGSVTAAVALTLQPVLEVTPSPPATQTPIPFTPFEVTTWADNVLLRANPGYLFDRLTALPDGTALTVVGQAPGGEWLLVQAPGNRLGWVFTVLVETKGRDMAAVPIIAPTDAMEIRGRVLDASGRPVSKIQYAITQGEGPTAPRNDANTDASGVFHAFMPPGTRGRWWVSYTAISCESSVVDANCEWVGTSVPAGVFVQLPDGAGTTLEFTWK